MRAVETEVEVPKARKRSRHRARFAPLHRSRLRSLALEPLEARTLMATLPPAVVTRTLDVSNSGGNQSSPSIAVNPTNPLQAVAVWTRLDPNLAPGPTEVTAGAYTNNGGASWSAVFNPATMLTDPTSSATAPTPFAAATDAAVDFDRNGNFYVLVSEHSAGNAAGVLLLNKYSLSSGTLSPPLINNEPLYSWTADQALKPMIAVDNNLPTFTDGTHTQTDPTAGGVYVAWASVDGNPNNFNNFNPNSIRMIASGDGGQSFSGQVTVNSNGSFGTQHDTSPRLVVGQGSATVAGGQVTVVFDDFGTLATATPTPLDILWVEHLQGAFEKSFAANPGLIQDAGLNNAPTTTNFNINITPAQAASFTSLSDLTLTLAIQHPAVGELTITLVSPSNQIVPLVANNGASGANMGIGTGGVLLGTTFDANSLRTIANGPAPYIGTFRPAGNLAQFFGQPLQSGTWQLQITDSTTGNIGALSKAFLTALQGFSATAPVQGTTTTVRGAQGIAYPTASAASPLGIGPGAVLASDNTLGAFSQFQGRLYLAYVNRSTITSPPNPADNTDIFLRTSDDGGTTWSAPVMVNNDVATTDGFSEGNAGTSGRAQFEPSVAVDQGTGTVVVTYYDGRYDAARARVATTIATSLDGGKTFGPQTFANTPLQVTDLATGQLTILGPIPDNESGGNTATGADLATFAFGDRQGLAVSHGHVYPAWSSNINGGNDGKQLLNIRVAAAEIAAGPRILSGTMGPVGLPGDNLNNTTAADGTPIAKSFIVTFDRPVDPGTFGIGQAQVFFHDTVAGDAPVPVTVTGVTPLNANAFGATQFRVDFTPSSQVGTYSYAVGPNIQDRIRSVTTTANPAGPPQTFVSANVPVTIPDLSTITSLDAVAGFPVNQVVENITVNLTITHTYSSDLQIRLFAPNGNSVLLAVHEPFSLDPGQNYTNTTFDDAAALSINQGTAPFTGTFRPVNPLAGFQGLAINGTWRLQVIDDVAIDSGVLNNWSLTITPGVVISNQVTGNPMDQNANATVGEANSDVFAVPTPTGSTPFQAPYKQDSLPLIVPGPHVVSTSVPGAVSDPNAPGTPNTLMLNGTVSSLVVTFDRDMDATTFTPNKVLRIEGPAGLISGPFTVTPVVGNARAFTIGFPVQQLSGTYTITLDSSIKSASGFALDTNLNAGVDVLRGTSTTLPVPLTFNSSGPVTITAGKTVLSQITLSNDFVIQGLTLTLDITYPFDPDLSAVLVAPDGTTIPLFTKVGTTGNNQNFTSTVFDDSATTPISNGGPPFFGRFKPEQPLGVLNNSSSVKGPGGTGTGVYTLEITNSSAATSGTLNSWSLTMLKPTPTSGLGEPVADRAQMSFRIFTMDPANPLSSNTWTSVGPASIGGTRSGRIGGIAVDPSDPSGNTVYVAGASGGIWKTNNFLTTSAIGPTYIPLTDFGPTFGINIGGIAVFGRNSDPNQSIIFVATGEGDTGSKGVGFLRSMDGGATWTLLDSTDNTGPLAARDHAFVGSNSFKILVDPRPALTGDVIIYAALSGTNGGIWRSTDSGMHWGVADPTTGKLVANFPGQATDVVFDPNSGPIDAVSNPTGNLQVLYAAFRGDGVYVSPNQGQVWNKLNGGVGDPFIQDGDVNPHVPITVNNLGNNPSGANGRIVLAKPDLFPSSDPNAALKNFIYQGWLYAAVVDTSDHLQGLYLTKDAGQNWTKLTLPTLPPVKGHPSGIPSNDTTLTNYDPVGNTVFAQGNYDVSLVSDPTNPEVVYLGGTADGNPSGLIRVDVSAISDPYAFFLANDRSDGGTLEVNSTIGVALKQNPLPGVSGFDPRSNPTINMTRNPANPLGNSTFYVNNTVSFANNGSGVKWIPFDSVVAGSTDQHRVIAIRDPLTGHARLIFGDDQGVFSGVDNGDGTLSAGIGTALAPTGSRNGNLQITQFYYGATQPSTSAATQIANALFYGSAQDDGAPHSTGDVLSTGNLFWTGPGGDYGGVVTDQTGAGTLYQYAWPCCGGNITDFFQVNGVGHTNGLVQASGGGNVPDPQWPFEGTLNFAVNPINGKQIVISSATGRVFRTEDQGANWRVLGDPPVFGSSNALALAFGAPDPALTGGALDNFIYIGTQAGHIFVTFTGGGATGNNWSDISAGLDGSQIMAIVTNPTRTSHEAFAVTRNGVYHITDSNPAAKATWVNITGNLFQITHNSFGDPNLQENLLSYLTSIQADWRYVLPNDPTVTGGPTHPMLYVGGEGGVYQSADLGKNWNLFPSTLPNSLVTVPTPPGTGGGLPDAHVTDLDLALGNVDPTTGRAVLKAGDPNVLLASTYGRGSFAIRLAPEVVPNTASAPNSLVLDPKLPAPTGSNNGTDPATGLPLVTVAQPVIDGLSEQSAFGNTVYITIIDLTDPANPHIIGGFDPTKPPAPGSNPPYETHADGTFKVQVNPNGFTTNGLKKLGIQATDGSGTTGNIATISFVLNAKLVSQQAPATPTLHLLAADDSSGGLNITNVVSPHLIGNTDPGVQVQLFTSVAGMPSGTALGTTTTDALGNYSIQLFNLPDGTHTYQAVATNTFGSSNSLPFTFTIKTASTLLTPTLALNPADDTGIVGDNITSARMPHFVGTTDPQGNVSIYQAINGIRQPQVLATTTADATGHFSIQLPNALNNGTISVEVGVTDVAGNQGNFSNIVTITVITVQGDYTGAAKTTPALFRRTATGTALWLIQGVIPSSGIPFGSSTLDIPFVGDFDGSGISSLATYRPSTNTWDIRRNRLGEITFRLGHPGEVPTVGNFDGIGVTETASYNPTTGTWTIQSTLSGLETIAFNPLNTTLFKPQAGDTPVPGNYNGTGKDELAVYRPSTHQFFIKSGTDAGTGKDIITVVTFAGLAPGDTVVPVPDNYDDALTYHQTEAAVFDAATGVWMINGPGGVIRSATFPAAHVAGDIPAPGDYDGTGKAELAVYRPSIASYIINGPSGVETVPLGAAGDVPLQAPLIYRSIVNTTPTLALDPAYDTGIKGDNITSARRPFFTGTTDANVLVDLIDSKGNVLGTGQADGNGVFHVQLSPNADLRNGSYTIQARAHGLASSTGPLSTPVTVTLVTVNGDYTGAGHADLALFRRASPYVIYWFVQGNLPPGLSPVQPFGSGLLDIPLVGDINGTGKDDLILFRPTDPFAGKLGQWFAQESSTGYTGQVLLTSFGGAGDIPVPANYNGTGKTVLAFYRPFTGQWFVNGVPTSTIVVPVKPGDIPLPGNYDNTGSDEFAIYRPSTSQWFIQGPNGVRVVSFGGPADDPVPGAYDAPTTSSAVEPAVYRPSTGQYFIHGPNGNRAVQFAPGDVPVPGDYDGIGVIEPAVYRPSTGQWFVKGPNDSAPRLLNANGIPFGTSIDIPVLTPYRYRALAPSASGITKFGSAVGVLDMGSTSQGLTSGSGSGSTKASTSTTLTPPPVAAPTTSPIRQRPNQHLAHHPVVSIHRLPKLSASSKKGHGLHG
jgi:subtilisin-like proprotein convertase family protein